MIGNDLLSPLQIDGMKKWQNKSLKKSPSVIALYALIERFLTALRKKPFYKTLWAGSQCKFQKNSQSVKDWVMLKSVHEPMGFWIVTKFLENKFDVQISLVDRNGNIIESDLEKMANIIVEGIVSQESTIILIS